MSIINRFLLLFLLNIILIYAAEATIRLELKELNNPTYNIDATNIPVFIANIKAFKDDIAYRLKLNEIVIVEDNRTVAPFYISDVTDGWQELRWLTTAKGFSPPNNVQIIVTIQNESVLANARYQTPNYSRVLIKDYDGLQIQEAHLGTVPAGKSSYIQINVAPYIGKKTFDNNEIPIRVDSVTVTSPLVKIKWQGNTFNRKPPPVTLELGSYNLVDLDYFPVTNDYMQSTFTVHYDGGMKEELLLTGNNFPVQKKQLLKLIVPNGGEKLTACQNITIKWIGAARDIPTIIEFTSNGGSSWNKIGESLDSIINWIVPKSYSDVCRIRVRQEFRSTSEKSIQIGSSAVQKLVYNNTGSRLLNANSAGQIIEYDMLNYQNLGEYRINTQSLVSNYRILGLNYLTGSTSFVIGYEDPTSFNKQDSLAFFNIGNSLPYLKIGLDPGYDIKRIFVDASKKYIACLPNFSNRILIYSASDGSFLRFVNFQFPVQSFAFNPSLDSAAAYLLNGSLLKLSLPDFLINDSFDLKGIPLVQEITLSPDGKLAALGCKTPKYIMTNNNSTENHVFDFATKQIVRTTRNTASDAVGLEFNPTSNVLLIGSKYVPQLALWDLVTGDFIGSLGGSASAITDFEFSPEGHTLAYSSGTSSAVTVKTFTYPEQDSSDDYFRIIEPDIDLNGEKIADAYLATDNEIIFNNAVCNTGEVPIQFDMSKFKNAVHFKLLDSITPVFLNPGECVKVRFIYHPLDTGRITDSLIFTSYCFGDFIIPVEAYSLKRNLSFLNDTFLFEETCVGESRDKRFDIIRNDDPVPIKINTIGFIDPNGSPFSLATQLIDTVLQPGEILNYSLRFKPNETGWLTRKLAVYHSDQNKMVPDRDIQGKGIGTILDISHDELLFIPEIKTRKITITNQSNTDVTIESGIVTPIGNFIITTNFPIFLPIGSQSEIEIQWAGNLTEPALLEIRGNPCAAGKAIRLDFYKATSELTIPNVEADPRGSAVIPINFSNNESKSYKGKRFFEASLNINPRLFLPEYVTSQHGEGKLIKNEVVNDRRIIEIRVDGDFPTNGIVAEIHGVAGLAETDTSVINFDSTSAFWGTSVKTSFSSGLYNLINIAEGRFLYQNPRQVSIINIVPNPASDAAVIIFQSKVSTTGSLEIFDELGTRILEFNNINMKKGMNNLSVNVSGLHTGNYRIMLKSKNSFTNSNFMIIR